jgi:aspartyl-tRNA(Asn)/glutamyl-tRNA(Gln) amidotransferase subunit A
MTAAEIVRLSALEQARLVAARELSAVALTRAHLAMIERLDPQLTAYVTVDSEAALATARVRDQEPPRSLLHGVPVAIKDNICTAGLATSCASRIFSGFVPPYDATAVARAREAGMVVLGKTNLDELGMGSSTEHSICAATANPWDPTRVAGGSSGGSAAAVAAGMAALALGSDTGGSVRQPASFCGVVGIKPTYGRVSRYGLVAFASSLDQIGTLGRTVADAAALLQVIAGDQGRDATASREQPPDLLSALGNQLTGLRIAVPRQIRGEKALSDQLGAVFDGALGLLAGLGCSVHEADLPLLEATIPIYYIIANAEASSNLARFDGMRYGRRVAGADLAETYCASRGTGFGPEVIRRILLGTFVLSSGYRQAYYERARAARQQLQAQLEQVLEQVDLLAMPTTPEGAFHHGERLDDPIAMYLSDVFTASINLAGLPAVSVPMGVDGNGMPLGLQLVAPAWREDVMLRAAARFAEVAGMPQPPPLPEVQE